MCYAYLALPWASTTPHLDRRPGRSPECQPAGFGPAVPPGCPRRSPGRTRGLPAQSLVPRVGGSHPLCGRRCLASSGLPILAFTRIYTSGVQTTSPSLELSTWIYCHLRVRRAHLTQCHIITRAHWFLTVCHQSLMMESGEV